MPPNQTLKDILTRYRKGEITLDSAAEEIDGVRLDHIGDIACMDTGRSVRCGMPEVVLAEGKDAGHLTTIALQHAETTGRCIITRMPPDQVTSLENAARTGESAPAIMKQGISLCFLRAVLRRRPGALSA